MKTITVVATFEARPGMETKLRQVLMTLPEPTRKEAGCLNYDLHVSSENPGRFLFHENWTSKELLDAHLKSVHIAAAFPLIKEYCASEPQIVIWEKIG